MSSRSRTHLASSLVSPASSRSDLSIATTCFFSRLGLALTLIGLLGFFAARELCLMPWGMPAREIAWGLLGLLFVFLRMYERALYAGLRLERERALRAGLEQGTHEGIRATAGLLESMLRNRRAGQ